MLDINEILDSLTETLNDSGVPEGPANRLRARIAFARLAPDAHGKAVALAQVRAALDDCIMCLDVEEIA